MEVIAKTNVRMPTYALPLIVNGDNTGINDEDMANILTFLDGMQKIADRLNCFYDIFEVDNTEYFSKYPEFGLACNVCDYVVLFMRP